MANKKGYVYILTNPSFREDWVKIGKSARSVEERVKELDTTAVPLPFEIYAWIKTSKYNEIEVALHKMIDQLSELRIRKGREFFNIPPEQAWAILKTIASTQDDVEDYVRSFDKDTKEGDGLKHRKSPTPSPVGEDYSIRVGDKTIERSFKTWKQILVDYITVIYDEHPNDDYTQLHFQKKHKYPLFTNTEEEMSFSQSPYQIDDNLWMDTSWDRGSLKRIIDMLAEKYTDVVLNVNWK